MSVRATFVVAAMFVATSMLTGCGGSNGSSGGGTPAPATPSGLVAIASDTRVSLSWSASSGATSYNVKRSTTTGGPYSQVAAVTTVSWTDTGVTDGTPYFYVVSAVNVGGESANSAQVSATPVAAPAELPGPSAWLFANPP